MYIQIPSTLFYFILGVVSTIVFELCIGAIASNNKKRQVKKDLDSFLETSNKIDNKKDKK